MPHVYTFNSLMKQLRNVDEQIQFIKEVQKLYEKSEGSYTCGNIINSLLSYKYYLENYQLYVRNEDYESLDLENDRLRDKLESYISEN